MTSWWRVICRVFEHPKKSRRTKFWKRARTFCNLHPCYNFALASHGKHLFSADQEGVIFSCALLPMQYTIDFWPIGQLGVIRYFLKSISHVEIECEWCNFYSKNLLVVQILFTRQVRVLKFYQCMLLGVFLISMFVMESIASSIANRIVAFVIDHW